MNATITAIMKSVGSGAGDTAHRSRALVALAEDLSVFLTPTLWLTILCYSSSRGSDVLF